MSPSMNRVSSKRERVGSRQDLLIALSDRKAAHAMITHAEHTHCDESARFASMIIAYIAERQPKKRRALARKILSVCVQLGSMYEVNLSASVRKQLLSTKMSQWKASSFDAALEETIFDMTRNPTYVDFLAEYNVEGAAPEVLRVKTRA